MTNLFRNEFKWRKTWLLYWNELTRKQNLFLHDECIVTIIKFLNRAIMGKLFFYESGLHTNWFHYRAGLITLYVKYVSKYSDFYLRTQPNLT